MKHTKPVIVNTFTYTAFKSRKLLIHSSNMTFAKKVIKDEESPGCVEYEEISDNMIVQARDKHLIKSSTCPTLPPPPPPPPPVPERPATQTTPAKQTTPATQSAAETQATSVPSGTCYYASVEDTIIYATPKHTSGSTSMATRDLTPSAAQLCVPPIVQCHDSSIPLTQNSAYQVVKQHTHAERS